MRKEDMRKTGCARGLVGRVRVVVAACALAAASAFAAADELVVNGGFERTDATGVVRWQEVGTQYVFRDGTGRSGTRGLAYVNDDPKFYKLPGQSLKLQPGKSYDFEVWVRTENLVGKDREAGASVCLEWSGNGKWIGGVYPRTLRGTKDWTCIKGRTPRMPPFADTFTVRPYVRRGMTGKAWFDDVSVREHVEQPVQTLVSTAYRDLAADGDVSFRAALNLAAAGGATNVAVTFTYTDASGAAQRAPADAVARRGNGGSAGELATLTRPVASLARGAQTVGVEARRRDGSLLGRRELTFTRAEKLPARAVVFDRLGRTLVRGEPFFPLGMYLQAVTTNTLAHYAQGPFNCLMPYDSPASTDLLDLCEAKGLKVIYSVKDVFSQTRWAPKGVRTEADETAWLEDRVARFKDHPALLAWYLNDELPLSMLPRLVARRKLMERLDPDHPGWVVLYQYSQILEYIDSFDVIGTDPYPIPQTSARLATTWTRETAAGTLGCKPLWQVPQAFDWAAFKNLPEERAVCRMPTDAEMRSMCWQFIANGANGLVLYSYAALKSPWAHEPFETSWAKCCRVGEEIRRFIPVLLSDERADEPPALGLKDAGDRADDVSVRSWWKGGAAWVLVVNGGDRPVQPIVRLSGAFKSVRAALGANGDLTAPSEFALSLAPLGVSFLRLDP